MIEQAGSHVAGYVDIGPAIVIEIGRHGPQSIPAAGVEDARFLRDIGKSAVAVVVVERVMGRGQSLRAAHNWRAFPEAGRHLAGFWRPAQIQIDIIGDEDVQLAVAVVIQERAAAAPAHPIHRQAGRAGSVCKFSVS